MHFKSILVTPFQELLWELYPKPFAGPKNFPHCIIFIQVQGLQQFSLSGTDFGYDNLNTKLVNQSEQHKIPSELFEASLISHMKSSVHPVLVVFIIFYYFKAVIYKSCSFVALKAMLKKIDHITF